MKILYIEACNFKDFPVGGQLTFSIQMLNTFGNDLQLVGITTDHEKSGIWMKKKIGDLYYDYFSLQTLEKITGKPLVPRRLATYLSLKRYRKKIIRASFDMVFCNSPEVLFAIRNWGLKNITFYFPGTGNMLEFSRRWYGRALAKYYYSTFLPSLKKAKFILAAADQQSIQKLIDKTNGALRNGDIIQFPSRIDTAVFNSIDKSQARELVHPGKATKMIVTTGRLHWVKGWQLLLESFKLFLQSFPDSKFYFIGDGDARTDIETFVKQEQLTDRVFLEGFKSQKEIANYLKAADLYVMGSFVEGWATSLVEAKACGAPVCTTNFSSANDIVRSGIDGFVCGDRDPGQFAALMAEAIQIQINTETLSKEMNRYSISTLHDDLLKIWNNEKNNQFIQGLLPEKNPLEKI